MIITLFARGGALLALTSLVAIGPHPVRADVLAPGETLKLHTPTCPPSGSLLAATFVSINTPDFRGTLLSSVWNADPLNPWDGLTFAYKLANASFCHDVTLRQFAVLDFGNSLTDVSFFGCGVAPRSAERSGDGELVGFNFLNRKSEGTLDPGEISAWLIVRTDCRSWQEISGVALNSVGVSAVTFAPTLVPEPQSLLLVFPATAIIVARGRRRNRNRIS